MAEYHKKVLHGKCRADMSQDLLARFAVNRPALVMMGPEIHCVIFLHTQNDRQIQLIFVGAAPVETVEHKNIP